MTEHDKHLIRASWRLLGGDATGVAEDFYARLFRTAPELAQRFATTDMTLQHARLIRALDAAVLSLDAPGALAETLRQLGARHTGYGVAVEDYGPVGAALLWVLQRRLGEDWSAETELAWTRVYAFVAEAMLSGAGRDAA